MESGLKPTLRILTGRDAIALIYNTCDTVNIGGIRFLYETVKKEVSLSVHNPDDKESMHRLRVKAIPSAPRENTTQQIAVSTNVKLINRSDALKDADSEKQSDKLNWHVIGERLERPSNEAYSDEKTGAIDTDKSTFQIHTRALSMGVGATRGKISPVIAMSFAYN